MSLLLDTNVLLRLAIDSTEISESFKEEVESGLADGDIAVSTVTFVGTTACIVTGASTWDAIPPSGVASGCDQACGRFPSMATSPSSRYC